jgi:hypothetical protein
VDYKEAKNKIRHMIVDLEEIEDTYLQGENLENIQNTKNLLKEIIIYEPV